MTNDAEPDLARLHYGDGDYSVLGSGRHVRCAVSHRPIPLSALRYWCAERQQAYWGPLEYLHDRR